MDYELAKKLKDAGYPLKKHQNQNTNQPQSIVIDHIQFHIPTLEELIEACDGKFSHLLLDLDEWRAGTGAENIGTEKAKGKTPTEAVANLFLHLNNDTIVKCEEEKKDINIVKKQYKK